MDKNVNNTNLNLSFIDKIKHNQKTSVTSFVKNRLPLYKEQLIKDMQSQDLGVAKYSANNCPTLFSMFNFNEIQIILQVVYNIVISLENIQELRQTIKSAKGLDKIKFPTLYKKIALNITEINDQLTLFPKDELPTISDSKSRFASALLLEILEVIYDLHEKSKRSSAFRVVIKTLTPNLEDKLPLFPIKISKLQKRIKKFDENLIHMAEQTNRKFIWNNEWQHAEKTLKHLYAKLNINFTKWALFKQKDAKLTTITEESSDVEENNY